jgi:putative ABC transport system permease protein
MRRAIPDVARDATLAVRLLARRPAFAAVALLTMALGIGAPTAIFSVVRAVLLRPLPYPDADRVLRFRIESTSPQGPVSFDALPVTPALEWAARSNTIAAMAIFNDRALTLTSDAGPHRLSGIAATPNLFDLLGVAPWRGQAFDARDGGARQIVLSYATWTRFFGADPDAIGTTATFDGEAWRIAGVMPPDFGFPTPDTAFWVPVSLDPGGSRGMLLPAIARMKPGAGINDVLREGRDALGPGDGPRVTQTLLALTLQEQLVGGVQRVLWVLLGAVGFVLVIATANIALLLLTRGTGREREFATRLALGAAHGRIVRQLFVEGLTLGMLGGLGGLVLAWLGLALLLQFAPAEIPRLRDATLDGSVLVFALALTAIASLVFGILSAGRSVTFDSIRAVAGASRESRLPTTAAASRRRLNFLAGAALALTMVLLVGAGLLLRSLVARVLVDQGFDAHDALALQVNLPAARYPNPVARLAFHDRLLAEIAATPGVRIAGLAVSMPNRQPTGRFDFNAGGPNPDFDPRSTPVAEVRMVSEGFVEAMGLRLRAGRSFRADDRDGAEAVMVISEQLARRHFPGRDPIGEILYSGTGNRRVVGVVGDVRPLAEGAEPKPSAYLPLRQNGDVLQWFAGMHVVVRGDDLPSLPATLRALTLALDPGVPPFNVRPLDEDTSRLLAGPRFSATLLAVFAAVALVMASIAVYGVMSYSASLRTREIGVRIALGSTRAQVTRLILRDGLIVVGGGLAAGLVGAVWIAQSLSGLLFAVSPADPAALASVAAVLMIAGLVAAWVPTRRATRINAIDALRTE